MTIIHSPKRHRHEQIFGLRDVAPRRRLGLGAVAAGIVLEEKSDPSRPEEQSAEESVDGLPRVALDEDSRHDDYESYESHEKCGIVEGHWVHKFAHDHHQGVA